ncbi:ribonuclease P protein subunit p25-like protein [Macaca fascicularis]|uniref:ribonuclease P protein subunit p25-like protein n=1 Tax=Macaca fascicularis TaxID=9541 RepID=UPI0032B05E22
MYISHMLTDDLYLPKMYKTRLCSVHLGHMSLGPPETGSRACILNLGKNKRSSWLRIVCEADSWAARVTFKTASRMEHYRKAGSVELPAPSPMPQLPPDTLEMRVRDGSKICNLLGLALGGLEGGSARHVVFSGSGRAAGKAVSCAEIVKWRVPGLHQLTKLCFLQTEDSWVPASPDTGLDPLTVRRHVPAVWVLLSRDPLDPNECGYQPPRAPPGLGSMPSSSCGPRSRRRARDTRS